jgi:hypothetical protein
LNVTIFDFVIWNEVQADDWFSLGGYPNTKNGPERIAAASKLYWMSSDLIMSKIQNARVYLSLDHTFKNSTSPAEVSGWDVLRRVIADSQGKTMHVAIHPYANVVGGFNFAFTDYYNGEITFGDLSVLTGYLQKYTSGATVMITEIGIVSNAPATEQIQSDAICLSYRQALASLDVTGYVYYQYVDISQSSIPNFKVGIVQESGRQKLSYKTWTTMDSSAKNCGFEFGNHTKVIRWRNPSGQYWITPRNPLSYGFQAETMYWMLLREYVTGTIPLYDCLVDAKAKDHFISVSAQCEGHLPIGKIGYAFTQPSGAYNRPIYRCLGAKGHFASVNADCEKAGKLEQLLGYGSAE